MWYHIRGLRPTSPSTTTIAVRWWIARTRMQATQSSTPSSTPHGRPSIVEVEKSRPSRTPNAPRHMTPLVSQP